MIAASIYYILL